MQRIDQTDVPEVSLTFEGKVITARQGDSVAAALLAADQRGFRQTSVSDAPRGPYCMIGVCFDCLVEIDGVANIQACMTEVTEGMQINRQMGAKDIMASGASG